MERQSLMGETELPGFLDGQAWVGGGEAFGNINPATGALIGLVHDADSADVDAELAALEVACGYR